MDDTAKIGKRGDVTILRDFEIQVGPRPLHHLSSVVFGNVPPKNRDDVKVSVYSLDANGKRGAQYDVLLDWESGVFIRVYMYFRHELPAGEHICFRVMVEWPGFSQLLDGKSEEVRWTFMRPCMNFRCRVEILPETHARPINVTPFAGSAVPQVSSNSDGTQVADFRMAQVPLKRRIGFTPDCAE